MARWRAANPEENRRRKQADYRKNRGTYIRAVVVRRFKLSNAEPLWLSPDDKRLIADIYCAAGAVAGVEVDHIVPLQGKTVCGLHVPWNLQIMAASQNRAKSNRLLEAA